MYSRKAKVRHGDDYWLTRVEIDGREYDNCRVEYDSSGAEPDVNWAGDMNLQSVMYKGKDLLPCMDAPDTESLRDRTDQHLCDINDPDNQY